jgi:hypothetical protein
MGGENRDQAATAGTCTQTWAFYNGVEVNDDSVEYGYFQDFVRDHPI